VKKGLESADSTSKCEAAVHGQTEQPNGSSVCEERSKITTSRTRAAISIGVESTANDINNSQQGRHTREKQTTQKQEGDDARHVFHIVVMGTLVVLECEPICVRKFLRKTTSSQFILFVML